MSEVLIHERGKSDRNYVPVTREEGEPVAVGPLAIWFLVALFCEDGWSRRVTHL